jgi:hypothetical protein
VVADAEAAVAEAEGTFFRFFLEWPLREAEGRSGMGSGGGGVVLVNRILLTDATMEDEKGGSPYLFSRSEAAAAEVSYLLGQQENDTLV